MEKLIFLYIVNNVNIAATMAEIKAITATTSQSTMSLAATYDEYVAARWALIETTMNTVYYAKSNADYLKKEKDCELVIKTLDDYISKALKYVGHMEITLVDFMRVYKAYTEIPLTNTPTRRDIYNYRKFRYEYGVLLKTRYDQKEQVLVEYECILRDIGEHYYGKNITSAINKANARVNKADDVLRRHPDYPPIVIRNIINASAFAKDLLIE